MTDTQNVPAGWYPDPNAPGGQRWWDGTQWTEHVGEPAAAQPFAAAAAPAGTKTSTVWIWLIVLLPLLGLVSLFTIDWKAYLDSYLVGAFSNDPRAVTSASFSLLTQPGYLLTAALGWIVYGVTVAFAALDVRELKKRGVPQPFHWAFAFLSGPVYVIGRSVVVKRRTGGGLAPLWVWVGTLAINLIAGIVLTALIFTYMARALPGSFS
ncbi:MAG TPA: DUF2510 domain-containing protein [Pseudolysinimonas sp.]|nr:DUF2510 domain-containing protein [Pseudolysinimonas sp.]